MQWSKKAKEIAQKECINFNADLICEIRKTFNEINKKRIEYKLEPKKRITRDVVEQTILNVINDTIIGGDIQTQEKEIIASEKVMYQ